MDAIARRTFLERLGAAFAYASVAACTRAPKEKIVPYASQPPEVIPGRPSWYASALELDGYATGVLVESHEGRPTKIEGNPDHPASLGASSAYDQAEIAALYDPERRHDLTRGATPASWGALSARLRDAMTKRRAIHVVMEPTGSPSIAAALETLHADNPAFRAWWHAPLARASAWDGARLAFGRVLEVRPHLRDARVVLALDADVLASGPAALRHARAFADGRRDPAQTMNRLYAVEAAPTVTGTSADHRLAVKSAEVLAVAAAIAGIVLGASRFDGLAARHAKWTRAVARDLLANRGRSLVVVGDAQPPEVHALAHAMNESLGNAGRTVTYARSPILDAGDANHDALGLARVLHAGEVDLLIVVGVDPARTSFADADLARAIRAARESVCLATHDSATSRACGWVVPAAHALEAWGDARAFDGTASIVQPLVTPLFGGRTALEVFGALAGEARGAYDVVRDRWRADWDASLRAGTIDGTAFTADDATVGADVVARLRVSSGADAMELGFRGDARIYDGRFEHDSWLREMPDPITKLTWDTAALIGPSTAARLGLATEDVVEIARGARVVRMPVIVVPGHAEDVVTAPLAFALRESEAPWFAPGARVTRTGAREQLAITQRHASLESRADRVLVHATLAEYKENPGLVGDRNKRPLMLYGERPSGPRQWAMAIDLTSCTGCSACVVACQAENNVPVVGKGEVQKGREMHWLRIDRYALESAGEEVHAVQPMLCQHCEKAPCEYVCPVNATVHSTDGLNQMVYNRCVGTRFCSNNCPYKVRRFNWFDYTSLDPALVDMAHNPDVTVRERGVMEKCTYCVQRIREAEIAAKVEARPLIDGDITTACEQACPARAIVFGDLADPGSRVARLHRDPRAFGALNDVGTVPRTRYLARIHNPNPELS